MDVGSRQCVAYAFAGIEVGIEYFPLFGGRDLREHLGGRIGQRTADAEYRLLALRRIDEDADLGLERLTHWLEVQGLGLREPVVRLVGGSVNRDRPGLKISLELRRLGILD